MSTSAVVSLVALQAAAWLVMESPATAATLPTGGAIAAGSGTITTSASTLTVTQQSPRLIATWNSFNIGPGSTVQFVQPSSSAVALNRVTGSDPSLIQGALRSNGEVFLINPNGVLFNSTAQVNTGGLVASTLDISNEDFLGGNYHFSGLSAASIINQGSLQADNGGRIVLIAAKIENDGDITATGGGVGLAAGADVTLNLGGPVSLQISKGALDALIQNGGAIRADGGTILLTAQAANDLPSTVINNTGVVEAQTLATGEKGEIKLLGGMESDHIAVGGTLDVSAPNGGDGGHIETSAFDVQTAPGLVVTAASSKGLDGSWLIDPYDYTVDATAAANIDSALNLGTSVTVSTEVSNSTSATAAGNITVTSPITKSAGGAATLTLLADNNITINSGDTITSTSGALNITLSAANAASATTGGVDVGANLSSNGGTILIGGAASATVGTAQRATSNGIGYALNASTSSPAVAVEQNVSISSGGGSVTINGYSTASSGGTYSGTAGGVYVKSGAAVITNGGNLFISGVSNIGAKTFGFSVEANSGTATFFTTSNNTAFGTATSTGTASAASTGNIVIDSWNNANSLGALGLVNNGSQSRVGFAGYSVANLLVEINGSLQNTTYGASSPVCKGAYTNCGTMTVPGGNNSYIYADYFAVTSPTHALYVETGNGSRIYDGTTSASGLTFSTVGAPTDFSTTGLTFSTPSKNAGAYNYLINGGADPGSFTSTATGTSGTAYAVGYLYGVYTVNPKPLTVSAGNKVYDGTLTAAISSAGAIAGDVITFSASGGFSDANVGTGKSVNVTNISLGGADAGNYSLASTTLTTTANITPRPVNLTGSRVYDTTTTISASAITLGNLVTGESLALSGSGSVASKDVASGESLSSGTLALGNGTGGLASNYTLVGGSDTANITPVSLTVTGLSAQSRTYDTTTVATLSGTAAVSGVLSGDTVTVSGAASGAFATKDVGTAKAVTVSQNTLSLGGTAAAAGDYVIGALPSNLTANITPVSLTVTGLSAQSRTYDTTTVATLSGTAAVSGVLSGDQVGLGGSPSAAFVTPDVGTNKPVNLSGYILVGIDSSDYVLAGVSTPLTANIYTASVPGPQTNPVVAQTTLPQADDPLFGDATVSNPPPTGDPGGLTYRYVTDSTSSSSVGSTSDSGFGDTEVLTNGGSIRLTGGPVAASAFETAGLDNASGGGSTGLAESGTPGLTSGQSTPSSDGSTGSTSQVTSVGDAASSGSSSLPTSGAGAVSTGQPSGSGDASIIGSASQVATLGSAATASFGGPATSGGSTAASTTEATALTNGSAGGSTGQSAASDDGVNGSSTLQSTSGSVTSIGAVGDGNSPGPATAGEVGAALTGQSTPSTAGAAEPPIDGVVDSTRQSTGPTTTPPQPTGRSTDVIVIDGGINLGTKKKRGAQTSDRRAGTQAIRGAPAA